jgi:hypothetical protein
MSSSSKQPINLEALPLELLMPICTYIVENDPIKIALRYRLVNRLFSRVVMDAIYWSDECLLGIYRTCGSEEKGSSEFWLSPESDFWERYLTLRVLGRLKKPTHEHLLIRTIAERVLAWRLSQRPHEFSGRSQGEAMNTSEQLEHLVRQLCRMLIEYGHCRYRTDIYIGRKENEFSTIPELALDDSCAWFREALLTSAAYLDERSLLQSLLDRGPAQMCTKHTFCPAWDTVDPTRRVPFACAPTNHAELYIYEGQLLIWLLKSRIWLGSPLAVAASMGNEACCEALLASMDNCPGALFLARAQLINVAAHIGDVDLVHMALAETASRSALKVCPPRPVEPHWAYEDRCPAYPVEAARHRIKEFQLGRDLLIGALDYTTDGDIFDLLYPVIGYECMRSDGAGIQEPSAADVARWKARRLETAAAEGVLHIVKKLLEMEAKTGSRPLAVPAQNGRVDVVRFYLELGLPTEGALAAAVRGGNRETVELLLEKGAGKKAEDAVNAI